MFFVQETKDYDDIVVLTRDIREVKGAKFVTFTEPGRCQVNSG